MLGSLKCDCAGQLQMAMGYIQENSPGLIIYLQQEGRGIGLANKIAAYALQVCARLQYRQQHCHWWAAVHTATQLVLLTMPSASSSYCRYACGHAKVARSLAEVSLQEEGLDTVDANRALGLPDDCREYSSVKNILKDLRIKSIRLMVRFASSLADPQGSG